MASNGAPRIKYAVIDIPKTSEALIKAICCVNDLSWVEDNYTFIRKWIINNTAIGIHTSNSNTYSFLYEEEVESLTRLVKITYNELISKYINSDETKETFKSYANYKDI